MKKIILSLFACMVLALSAQAMTYGQAQREALFLTDKMAFELNLSTEQFEAIYEINLDYLMLINRDQDIFGIYWERRNADLRYVLNSFQYRRFVATNYFYRPLNWGRSGWTLAIYGRYTDPHMFYFSRPRNWNSYRGGHNMGARSHYQNRNFYAPGANGRPSTGHMPPSYNRGNGYNGYGNNYRGNGSNRYGNRQNYGNGVNGGVSPHNSGGYYNNGNGQPGNNRGSGNSTGRHFGKPSNQNDSKSNGSSNSDKSSTITMPSGSQNSGHNGTNTPQRRFGR